MLVAECKGMQHLNLWAVVFMTSVMNADKAYCTRDTVTSYTEQKQLTKSRGLHREAAAEMGHWSPSSPT